MTTLVYLLQAPAGGGTLQLVLLGGMIVVFYFFMIRPQAKKAKEAKQFQTDLQKGDKIVTIAGIHGTINKVNEDGTTIMLETSPGSYIKVEKSAISIEWSKALNQAPAAK
ncbi:MAG: preprotein translocase subunit YajC [Chitinophagaceae bacterium]|uniref:preprotein translocase subunit YajC n=1 Tax=unclassified Paraflavitalea TaxID=2798305 RepID=UPI003D342A32|nr:preprotein translocase subunit YajC [Chitinophagaceae bacterium]